MAASKESMLADIEALNDAIASGERQVTVGGTTVTYNTTESLIKARNDIRAEMTRLFPAEQTRRRQFRAYHAGRGFDC